MLSYDKHGWLVKKPPKTFEKYLNLLISTCHIFSRCQASSSPEAVVWRCSVKKVFLEISQNSQKTRVPETLFQQSCRPKSCNSIMKEPLAQVFSCEFCKISKNSFFYRTPPVTASSSPKQTR